MIRACIFSANGSISTSDHSHRSSWPKMRRLQILEAYPTLTAVDLQPDPATLGDYDVAYHYAGMEWSGILNLFGGATEKNAAQLDWVTKVRPGHLVSLDVPMPDFGALAASRPWDDVVVPDWGTVSSACAGVRVEDQPRCDRLVVGDSHATSQYTPGTTICRNDFKTLHGALATGLGTFLTYRPRKITWYFGNIDVRHHLCRQPDPAAATRRLVAEYVDQVAEASRAIGADWEIVEPLLIESETRSIPQSGFFKGRPFWGSWAERMAVRDVFIATLDRLVPTVGGSIYQWPTWFRNPNGELDFEVMEKPGSVHLAWKYARAHLESGNAKPNPFDELFFA